ncbi:MAG: TIGR01244 family phosphatase [Rhizobiaceae bacterium]|nr:TIGR01244 family phosphatase [Rhizobiaceae bacterium]
MQAKPLSRDFAVSEQIAPGDVDAIAQAGYRSIVCARPDGEGGPAQPRFAEIEAAAAAAGIKAAYIPIVPGQMTRADVEAFKGLLATLPGPVFGYCRSGARAASLWQAAQPGA